MSKYTAILIYVFSGMITGFSQLLLKLAVNGKKSNNFSISALLDLRIICAYMMMMGTIFLNMYAIRYLQYKMVPALSTVSYIFVLLIGRIILKEQLEKRQWWGIVLIVGGIIIFNME